MGNILFAFAVSGQAHGPQVWPLSLMLVLVWLPFQEGSYGLACCLALAILALNASESAAFAIAGLVRATGCVLEAILLRNVTTLITKSLNS